MDLHNRYIALVFDGVTIKVYNPVDLYSGNQSFLCKPLSNTQELMCDVSDKIIYHYNKESISKYALDISIFKNCIIYSSCIFRGNGKNN